MLLNPNEEKGDNLGANFGFAGKPIPNFLKPVH